MSEEMIISEEMQEVAEPVTDNGEEVQETAEPVIEESSVKSDSDRAFAEMRRRAEDYERRFKELQEQTERERAEYQAEKDAINALAGDEDALYSAIAEANGYDVEDVSASVEARKEIALKDLQLQQMQSKLDEVESERQMQADLVEIQKLDPNIKSLSELGDTFLNLKSKGCDALSAYWACMAERNANKYETPKSPGKVNTDAPEKTYFTAEEVKNMNEAELEANWEAIEKSRSQWR